MKTINLNKNELKSIIKESIINILNESEENVNFTNAFETVYTKITETNDSLYHLYDQFIEELGDTEGDILEEMYNTSMKLRGLANTLGQRLGVVGY